MTFDALQKEIEIEANLKGAEILLGLWHRVKEMSHHDVTLYCSLIDIYTNFRIYHHRVKRWMEDAYSYGDNTSNKQYCKMVSLNKMCEEFFAETALPKATLRQKLLAQGIDYRRYHPSTYRLNMEKVFDYPTRFDVKKLDWN